MEELGGRSERRLLAGLHVAHLLPLTYAPRPRLYGFKIHPMAYQLQLQAASNFKSPVKTIR